jgi:hypothetical protein
VLVAAPESLQQPRDRPRLIARGLEGRDEAQPLPKAGTCSRAVGLGLEGHGGAWHLLQVVRLL